HRQQVQHQRQLPPGPASYAHTSDGRCAEFLARRTVPFRAHGAVNAPDHEPVRNVIPTSEQRDSATPRSKGSVPGVSTDAAATATPSAQALTGSSPAASRTVSAATMLSPAPASLSSSPGSGGARSSV